MLNRQRHRLIVRKLHAHFGWQRYVSALEAELRGSRTIWVHGTLSAVRAAEVVSASEIASRIELLPVAFSPRITSDGARRLAGSPGRAAGSLKDSCSPSIALKLLISTAAIDVRAV